eukprot:1157184-Pelagomonas_calceolata.AAC.1
MESLLHWLHAGGRVFEYGCLSKSPQSIEQKAQNKISSGAFADDLICITGTYANLRIQAKKLTLYANWDHLIISGNKTKVTCSLPGPQCKELRLWWGSSFQDRLMHAAGLGKRNLSFFLPQSKELRGTKSMADYAKHQLQNKILVQGKPAQFIGSGEPFTYLGVQVTMTLDWEPQLTKMTDKLTNKLQNLGKLWI